MADFIDHAKESLEHAHHAALDAEGRAAHHTDKFTARVALVIAALAAGLALSDIAGKAAQNAYLTDHIAVSDTWNFFQAKNIRATTRLSEASVLESLPNAADPEIGTRAKAARDDAARLRDDPKSGEGSKQLAEKAKLLTAQRDEEFHIYHQFELVTGALQIAIVLASVSVVTRILPFVIAASVLGGLAAAYGVLVAIGVV